MWGTGSAVATVRKLLPGAHEYWFYVIDHSPAGAVTVTLSDAGGQVRSIWSSPANANGFFLNWHVFDVDGATGVVTAVDHTNQLGLLGGARDPNTNVCPTNEIE